MTPAAAAGDWSSLYTAQAEPLKAPRHGVVAVKKTTAYGGGGRRIKNLEMCTEALGCETGGVDGAAATAADAAIVVAAAVAEDAMAVVETDGAERKRRAREEAESMVELAAAGRVRRAGPRGGGGALPPPLTTLARGGSRVRMVQERRDGRLAVYAVRTAGVQAERCGGRLRLRLVPCAGCSNAAECHQKEKQLIKQEAEEAAIVAEKHQEADDEPTTEEEYGGVAKYVRGGRCVEAEVAAAAAARRGKNWEPEQAAPILGGYLLNYFKMTDTSTSSHQLLINQFLG